MSNLKEESTIELIKKLTLLERQIDIYILKYNEVVKEMYERIPTLETKKELKILIKNKTEL